jgi:hypothetical protein
LRKTGVDEKRDYFKLIVGKTLEEFTRVPSGEEVLRDQWKQIQSNYPLRSLGANSEKGVSFTEEERTHTHIIGTTQVGKSKLIEKLIRDDIDRGNGLCFIDSSDNGKTVYDVLRYCASKKLQKVILIDPLHCFLFNKVIPINPFGNYPDESAEKVMDIIQIQFQQTDFAATPVIKHYLPAIVRTLHRAGLTLAESIYFTDRAFESEREQIYIMAGNSPDVTILRGAFKYVDQYREFRPTGRRFADLTSPILKTIFGTDGIDFKTLIRDKWVVLVNLYPKKSFGISPARFLGTAIINEFYRAIDDLITGKDWLKEGWKGRYYLYIDEGGRYANRNVEQLLSYKGKTGLKLIFAHQYFDQIEDPVVRSAILNQTDTKIVFRMPNPNDRQMIARMIYGGQVADRDASYYLGHLRKQECVVKLPGQDAVKIKVEDVPEVKVDIKKYIDQIYSSDFYKNADDIEREINARIITGTSNQPSQKRAASSDKSSGSSSSSRRGDGNSAGKARLAELRKNKRATTDNPEEPKTSD